MRAFSVPRTLAVMGRHGFRRIPGAMPRDEAGGLDPACVILTIHDGDRGAARALEASRSDQGPEDRLRLYSEAELAAWPGWPMRLGRSDRGLAVISDPAPLGAQLAALRARRPGRRRFRVALVGGFGFNLGDTLLGATASAPIRAISCQPGGSRPEARG